MSDERIGNPLTRAEEKIADLEFAYGACIRERNRWAMRAAYAKKALEAIAQGRPDDVTPQEWGEWCTQWAKDELNALSLLTVKEPAS